MCTSSPPRSSKSFHLDDAAIGRLLCDDKLSPVMRTFYLQHAKRCTRCGQRWSRASAGANFVDAQFRRAAAG